MLSNFCRADSLCIYHLQFYFLFTAVSLLVRVISIQWVYRYICAHSDGGGNDAGTDYTFTPHLKYRYSIVACGYDTWPRRGRMLSWFILPWLPVYWFLQLCTYVWLLWSLACYWITEGEIVRQDLNVPREWYANERVSTTLERLSHEHD